MKNIFSNLLRGIKKRLLQYFGIIMLLIIVVATLSALYSNSQRIESGFYTVLNNSGKYDYRINVKTLNNYKDITKSKEDIKIIIKAQFKGKNNIYNQINKINENNIINNTFPELTEPINPELKTYLLNWGLNYQSILVNNILQTDIINNNFNNYIIDKSFFKTFNYQSTLNNKSVYYSLEDAFYDRQKLPESFDFLPTRNNINEVYIAIGHKPVAENEIIINPDFAQNNGIKLNDNITVSNAVLKVVGFGYAYWGITGSRTASNPSPKPINTTPIYTTRTCFDGLINNAIYRTNLNNIFLLKVKNNDSYFLQKLQAVLNKTFSFTFGTIISTDTEDAQSGQMLETFKMQNLMFLSISLVVLMIIIFIVMSYVRKEIDLQKPQIGLLKALGYTNTQIAFGFIFLIFFITFIANIVGLSMGLGLQILFNSLNKMGLFMPLPTLFFSWIVFTVALIFIPLFFAIITYLQSNAKLGVNTLTLIYDYPSNTNYRLISFLKYPFRFWPFKQRLVIAFTLKSVGKLVLVFFTFIFVSFLLLFQTTATDLFDNKINNLYGYYNGEVKWQTSSSSMYNYDIKTSDLVIKDQIFEWVSQKDIQQDKTNYQEWLASDFQIDKNNWKTKIDKIKTAKDKDNYKNNYISSHNLNILYQNSKTQAEFKTFVDPDHLNSPDINFFIPIIYKNLHQIFDYISINTGIDPKITPLPGISLGMNIYNANYYPDIETELRIPNHWQGHNQGPMIAKKIKATGIYNDSFQNLSWNNWFNFKEEKERNLSFIFDNSHNITTHPQKVIYTDNQGQTKDEIAYVVPAVISKALAILNGYKMDSNFLMLTSWYNYTVPIIFNVQGIIINNLDTSNVYVNLNDLRTAIGLIDENKEPLTNSFNNLVSKEKNIFPLNYINILQSDNKYDSKQIAAKNLLPINKVPLINELVKKIFIEIFGGIRTIINITKFLTLFAIAFVLIIVVNMILDNNLLIIAMMKSLGYRVNEINRLIIGSYIIALIIAFILGTIFSYSVWSIITLIIVVRVGIVFMVTINPITILSCFSMVFLMMVIGYGVGLYLIKYRPVTVLLQG